MPDQAFSRRFEEYSDEQLLEISYQAQDYVPEAILAAETILIRRGVDPNESQQVQRYEIWKSKKVGSVWEWALNRFQTAHQTSPDAFLPRSIPGDRLNAIALGSAIWFMVPLVLYAIRLDFPDLLAALLSWFTGMWLPALKALPVGLGVVVVYLLISMNRWGWILGFITLTGLLVQNLWAYSEFDYAGQGASGGNWLGNLDSFPAFYLIEAGLDLSVMIHLLRKEVRSAFKTLQLPAGWLLGFVATAYVIYWLSNLA